jgi:hypothetical protein
VPLGAPPSPLGAAPLLPLPGDGVEPEELEELAAPDDPEALLEPPDDEPTGIGALAPLPGGLSLPRLEHAMARVATQSRIQRIMALPLLSSAG